MKPELGYIFILSEKKKSLLSGSFQLPCNY